MFIENGYPKDFSSLQRSETDAGVACHCRKHCAPLERGRGSQPVSINIGLRRSQALLGCGLSRAEKLTKGTIPEPCAVAPDASVNLGLKRSSCACQRS